MTKKTKAGELSPADKIIAGAFALAVELGITEREIAASAMKLAVVTAEKQVDPDAWLAALISLHVKETHHG